MAVFVDADSVQPELAPPPVLPAAPPLILSRLKLETRSEHDAVERVLDLMDSSLTREGYRQRLEQFYGFYAPLEEALQAHVEAILSLDARLALSTRLGKARHLRQDLRYLGVMTEDMPLCRDLPPLDTQAGLLGCLYVLEGATLGGRIITQHVRATLGVTAATGGLFFEGYGDATGKMWQSMRQLLVSGAPDARTENAMVTNATTTFACLRRWCVAPQARGAAMAKVH
jgi:heme oxygenase (biliverdin-IX-beta and delta-forming)